MVRSGISVRIPDQTAHLDRTYDCHCYHHRVHRCYQYEPEQKILPANLEPEGKRGRHNPEGLGRGGRGGAPARALLSAPRSVLEGFLGSGWLPGASGSYRALARVQEGHKGNGPWGRRAMRGPESLAYVRHAR